MKITRLDDPDYPAGIDYHWQTVLSALIDNYGLNEDQINVIVKKYLDRVAGKE